VTRSGVIFVTENPQFMHFFPIHMTLIFKMKSWTISQSDHPRKRSPRDAKKQTEGYFLIFVCRTGLLCLWVQCDVFPVSTWRFLLSRRKYIEWRGQGRAFTFVATEHPETSVTASRGQCVSVMGRRGNRGGGAWMLFVLIGASD
jgi:hypothetical protein